MIRAIIFDCFGVLATDGFLPFLDKYFGNGAEQMRAARDMRWRVDAGHGDYYDMIREVGRMAGISEEEARTQIINNVPGEKLFAFIENVLKPSYKIGMLSNSEGNILDTVFQPEQVALFDAIALSYETGHVKPEQQAYEIIAERLGVNPEECLFVDDQERYCIGAQEAGMETIQYRTFEQFHAELQLLVTAAES